MATMTKQTSAYLHLSATIPLSLIALALAVFLSFALPLIAQDAVPAEILQRTVLIKVGDAYATAFTIDYQGKLYLVTARHVVAALPDTNATLQVKQGDEWAELHTVRTLYPPSKEVDIAVFETGDKVSTPFQITAVRKGVGAALGQQIWFLGYPWAMGSRFMNGEIPFVKRGTMSAVDHTNPDAVIVYIDGFNNPGFSGGPIIYWDLGTHTYGILGVIKGYRDDTAKLMVNGGKVDTQLVVNSGILVGYSIQHAIQAIEQSNH
jgi:hypothetical protein